MNKNIEIIVNAKIERNLINDVFTDITWNILYIDDVVRNLSLLPIYEMLKNED